MKMPEIDLPEGVLGCFHAQAEQVSEDLAARVAAVLRGRLAQADRASLVVSGGSTPVAFFNLLSEQELDWSRVDVLLADERWVPEHDPASNGALVRKHLLKGAATNARFLPLKMPAEKPELAVDSLNERLAGVAHPLDVVVLGMGTDGHTASLFPDAPELCEAMSPKAGIRAVAMNPPSQSHPRVSLSRAFLAGARFTALHLRGDDKLETLRAACQAPENEMAMPVRAFLKSGLRVFWSP